MLSVLGLITYLDEKTMSFVKVIKIWSLNTDRFGY
jgi:hypothetical protein